MNSFIIYCPHLNRDVRNLLNAVPNPRIFTGLKTERGEDGCLEAHKSIVRGAQQQGWPFVFVMEDDCQFVPSFSYAQWLIDVDWAMAHGYGAVSGGAAGTWSARRVRDGLISVARSHSAHCMAYTYHGYEAALRAVQPYDLSIGDCGVNQVVVWPFVAVQRPCYSGILGQEVDYVHHYERHERELRSLM